MGVERTGLLKLGVDDMRLFFENDLRFLEPVPGAERRCAMKLPLSWMRDFVSVDATVEEISRRLSFAGLVVENIEKLDARICGRVRRERDRRREASERRPAESVRSRCRRRRTIQSRMRRAQRARPA